LGVGTVASDYYYDPDHQLARHARKVKWERLGKWVLPEDARDLPMKTLTELPTNSHSVEALEKLMKLDKTKPIYSLAELSRETHTPEATLSTWLRALARKGQAVLYGPPGTGKTFVAQKLARHLVGGGDGFVELVQFHPAYAYEDFIQGIRPRTVGGKLDYVLEPGRFLEFCTKAEGRKGVCVLIIDEINRANLARVFGELMYLLEYRDDEVPLAGGSKLKIPKNVRLIGTMNTADRSIALVDHALRRRFAFIGLYPNHQVLRDFHKGGANQDTVPGLVNVLEKLNKAINDRHYEVGISFFLKEGLKEALPDIWQMEIEPYLEEYFFDKPSVVDQFRWAKIGPEILK
jgi:5-methylcytosine-specific restriction protein B